MTGRRRMLRGGRVVAIVVAAVSVLTAAAPAVAASEHGDPADTVARIGVRTVDGVGELYRTDTGERFVPRGVNYLDFVRDEDGRYRDAVFATATYDAERVRDAFSTLADHGYDTVRIFFDTCGIGSSCIGIPGGQGIQPAYLDHMADVMRIAADEGIYLLLTANSIPDDGGYWEHFDRLFGSDHRGFTRRENADWLHTAGVETKARFWDDLLSGLAERDAPFETVLGWQLTNEFWLFREHPPMSLEEGVAETANGQTYDLSKPREKRRMVADGVVHFVGRMREVIERYDPEGLVTMGFYAPAFQPHTFVDTASLIERLDVDLELDFLDLHAYSDTGLSARQQARSFGMLGHAATPIIMGETGSGKAIVPNGVRALDEARAWMSASCRAGWDGWLNWGYHPWPEDLGGAAWAFLDDGGRLLEGLSPEAVPDPCARAVPSGEDLARTARPRATSSAPDQGPRNVLDGSERAWNAGDFPPHAIELRFRRPAPLASVDLAVDQWPPGPTHHRVWARLRDGRDVLVADLRRFLHPSVTLPIEVEPPLPGVRAIRIETLASPSWVAWSEISALRGDDRDASGSGGAAGADGTVCVLRARWLFGSPAASAEVIRPAAASRWVLAEARLADDPRWLRVRGDGWVRAGRARCPGLPLVDGPASGLVPVRFRVTVPRGSGEVFLAGRFGAETGLPIWDPATVLLDGGRGRRRTVELPLPRGEEVRYIVVQGGSWAGREMRDDCEEVEVRTLTAEPGLLVRAEVARWADGC